jgi:hypothetical protein
MFEGVHQTKSRLRHVDTPVALANDFLSRTGDKGTLGRRNEGLVMMFAKMIEKLTKTQSSSSIQQYS